MLKDYVAAGIHVVFAFSLLFGAQNVMADAEIVGSPKCKTCHKKKTGDQWKIWLESAHARAFETLASEESKNIATGKGLGDPQTEETCLRCHVTRLSPGIEAAINANAKYSDDEGVGCEACHGPGSDYKARKVMMDPVAARENGLIVIKTAAGCTQCHNEESPTYREFDFKKRMAEIAHPVPGPEEEKSVAFSQDFEGPDDIIYTSSVGDVIFTHNKHAREENIECVECHHQIHAKDLQTPHPGYMTSSWINCRICHDEKSERNKEYYKCSDCHLSDLDDIADETLSSKVVVHKNCWGCHDAGTGVEASQSCAGCHVKQTKNNLNLPKSISP